MAVPEPTILDRAVAAHRAGDLDRAQALYRQVLVQQPTDAAALANLAGVHRRQRRVQDAETCLRRLLHHSPHDVGARYSLANLLSGEGRWDDAVASYRAALLREPDRFELHTNLGVALDRMARHDEARQALRRAARLNPNDAAAHGRLATLLDGLGMFADALTSYRRFQALSPPSPPLDHARFAALDRMAVDHRDQLARNRRDLALAVPVPADVDEAPDPAIYLSIVACTRNDDHGGDALARTNTSLNWTIEQCERHGIDAELVLVDWNPPPDRPRLSQALTLEAQGRHVRVRHLVVPPSMHERLFRGTAMAGRAMAYALGLNVGIRRARGRFVLPATTDVVYSDRLMAVIARRDLREDRYYRAERADVPRAAVSVPRTELLAYCAAHVFRTWPRRLMRDPWPADLPMLFSNACGDFTVMARSVMHRLRGFREDDPTYMHCDAQLLYGAYGSGVREVVIDAPVYHIDHDGGHESRLVHNPEILNTGLRFNEVHGYYQNILIDLGLNKIPYRFNALDWGLGNVPLAS